MKTIVSILVATLILLSGLKAEATIYYVGDRAFSTESTVVIFWQANPEPDVAGYEVHRANSIGGPYAKLHEGLVAETSYSDSGLSEGVSYFYQLRAVDTCGNMSDFCVPSEELLIDETAPNAVTGFVASYNRCEGKVRLTWEASTDLYFKEFILRRDGQEIWKGTELSYNDLPSVGAHSWTLVQTDFACWESQPVGAVVDIVEPDVTAPTAPAIPGF